MNLPSFGYYGPGSDFNGRAIRFNIGPLTLFYSYQTIVAFSVDGSEIFVSQNIWSNTTGKHLNAIDGGGRESRKARLPWKEFEAKLQAALSSLDLI